MRRYSFILNDYKAVNSAAIVNDGITVIAGGNGCGKSTISRLLCNIINVMSQFDSYVVADVRNALWGEMFSYFRVLTQINRDVNSQKTLRDSLDVLNNAEHLEDLQTAYTNLRNTYDPLLRKGIDSLTDNTKKERFFSYLKTRAQVQGNDTIFDYLSHLDEEYHSLLDGAMNTLNKQPASKLIEFIQRLSLESDNKKISFNFKENEVDLIKNKFFIPPLSLNRAIYVDTPMAVDEDVPLSRTRNNLATMMVADEKEITSKVKQMDIRIRQVIKGQVFTEKDIFEGKELHYKRTDGLNILLSNAATGIKAFAYIEALLRNGFLDDETMLIIDEPEAHLHPQWIVEFARILVLLNKEIGVHILIASHNPDMVAAIRAISEKEDVLVNTNFYLATESNNNSFKYDYQSLGTDISLIFKSFNIALERIKYYGAGQD